MFRLYACLTTEHDLRLVVLAGVICFLASLTAVNLVHRARATHGRARALWVGTAGAAAGCGIWATHFIAMLAYDPGLGVNYRLGLTVLSLAVAAVVTGLGLGIAVYHRSRWAAPLGGGVVGGGVASMHYLGMWALEMPGRVVWSVDLVLLSVGVGIAFAAAGLWLAIRRSGRGPTAAAGLLLTLAIVSHHFTAMGAVIVVPDPTLAVDPFSLSPAMLAMGIANAAVATLVMSLAGAFVDKRASDRIAHMAYHDPLTGLPNRAAFTEQLASVLDRCRAGDAQFAVLCIDLDRFKEVNDLFGHAAGDRVLKEISARLAAAAGRAFLARLGGDEFTVLLEGEQQPAGAEALGERVLGVLATELDIDAHRVRVGMSVGVAVFPGDGQDASTLLSNADAALYRAKAEGRGHIRFFAPEMDQSLRERRALQHDLRAALERDEMMVFYQPLAMTAGEITGFEALARWQHPTRGMVPPATFIAAAEESSLIVSLGEWVLRTACAEAASWPKPLRIAVNLSPVQFRHGDLAGLVHTILLETGLSPSRLELEITEGVLIGDFSRALSILRRLKSLGVRIAMDDFGTGYSSLSYLQSFPFDKIKIDRGFIAKLQSSPQSAAIVRAAIGLARGLDVPVLAEGVETAEQLEFLSRESCNEVQGYLIGRPSPIEAYAETVGRVGIAERARGAA